MGLLVAGLDRRHAVRYLPPTGVHLITADHDVGLTWMVGAPVEDAISVIQPTTWGIPSRYPSITNVSSGQSVAGERVFIVT